LLTVDVEDWFQVENFKSWIPFETWGQRELRVERNVHRLLDLFDSVESAGMPETGSQKAKNKNLDPKELDEIQVKADRSEGSDNFRRRWIELDHFLPENDPAKNKSQKSCKSCQTYEIKSNPFLRANGPPSFPASQLPSLGKPKATFFVLGWLAERLPHLVREIQSRGHEVASHGRNHELPNSLSPKALKTDLIDSKKLLEDIIGQPVTGYRAPSFAIDDDILKTIGDCGYHYDSSYNSFSLHGRYGQISLNGTSRKGIAHKIKENFYELPVSNLQLTGFTFPLGGGGYFRLIPAFMFNSGIKKILQHQDAYVFYAHPWEFDPEQPKVNQASFSFKFRHYNNLHKTETRLRNLIGSFDDCRFVTCSEYLSKPMVNYED